MTFPGFDFLTVSFIIAPLLCIVFSLCLGEVMGIIEGWEAGQGFWYISVNMAGLPNPYVNVSPLTIHGKIINCISAVATLLFSSTVVGVCGMLYIISDLPAFFILDHPRHGNKRAALAVFCVIPLVIQLACLIFGVILAAFEKWAISDGFLYVLSAVCGLGTPMTNVNPENFHGRVLGVILGIAAQGVIGAIIGVLAGIGPLVALVANFEKLPCFWGPQEKERVKEEDLTRSAVDPEEALNDPTDDPDTQDKAIPQDYERSWFEVCSS
uniref:Uncharacterized protein n=1 Tax=Octactis speculum TaxID=3111310 RepID=A0A7S2CBQ4_9STRA|mmetsp:Transcript_34200/g.46262  ORF Transcript_34200/g.46262 Transcript_34200/m.46262 type:complete len:268 (+) Transcript_34200:55-858(+)